MENTNLETLAIENTLLYPAFDTEITQYEAEVSNEIVNLNLLAVPEDEQATVDVTGTADLKVGENIIDVVVTASEGVTKREYVINVTRRNLAEEQYYLKEQEENKEKLEEIYRTLEMKEPVRVMEVPENYEATRTSATVNVVKENSNNWYIAIGVVIIAIAVVFTIIKLNSKKCNKDNEIRK